MNTKTLKYLSNFILLKRNAWLLLAIGGISFYWYHHFSALPGDAARVQIVISMITLLSCASIFTFSLLTTLPAYLAMLFKKRVLETEADEKKDVIKISFQQAAAAPGLVDTEVKIYNIRRPLLGFAKVTIIFEDYSQTEEILLTEPLRERGKKVGIIGRKALFLPNIKDYRIHSSIIHFEDFFHLFALPYKEAEHVGIFTEPPKTVENSLVITTKSSEEPVKKVIQHRTAKGELLDYKKYAPGDDVRRIIWKNYARSRELTVRIHDRTFPYVSHINVLASFFDATPPENGSQPALKEMLLDIYKEKIRQVIDAIIEQEFTVRFFTDQPVEQRYSLDEYQQMLYRVSASGWQRNYSTDQFVKDNYYKLHKGSTIVLVSSLCPVKSLEHLQSGRPRDVTLCFYNAAKTLALSHPPALLKRILFVDAFEPLESAKRERQARPIIKFIADNNQNIEQTLNHQRHSVIEL